MRESLLVFEVGSVSYGIDIHAVREVLRPLPVQQLPSARGRVVGAVEHRGEILPVVDARLCFGLPSSSQGRDVRFLIVQDAVHAVVLLVDRVIEVWSVEPSQHRPLPDRLESAFLDAKSAYAVRERLVFVIESASFIDAAGSPQGAPHSGLAQRPQ